MPEMLRSHVRYPEVLFQAQATMYSTFHVTNEQVFYNKEDLWTIAQQSRTQSGQRTTNVDRAVLQPDAVSKREECGVRRYPSVYAGKQEQHDWLDGGSQRRRGVR